MMSKTALAESTSDGRGGPNTPIGNPRGSRVPTLDSSNDSRFCGLICWNQPNHPTRIARFLCAPRGIYKDVKNELLRATTLLYIKWLLVWW